MTSDFTWVVTCGIKKEKKGIFVYKEELSFFFIEEENSYVLSEYEEIVFSPFTFLVDLVTNLMRRLYHKCEKMEHHSPSFKNS